MQMCMYFFIKAVYILLVKYIFSIILISNCLYQRVLKKKILQSKVNILWRVRTIKIVK